MDVFTTKFINTFKKPMAAQHYFCYITKTTSSILKMMFHTNIFQKTADLFITSKKWSVIERYSVTSFHLILNRPIPKEDAFDLIHSATYIYYRKYIGLQKWRDKSRSVHGCQTKHCPFHVNTVPDLNEEKCIIIAHGNLEHSQQCLAYGHAHVKKKVNISSKLAWPIIPYFSTQFVSNLM